MSKPQISICILALAVSFMLLAQTAAAQVSLYLLPSDLSSESDSYREGQRILVRVQMDTGEETVGVAEGTISFPSEALVVRNVSKEGSIFKLWAQEPAVSGNTISFVGGIPGGFNGEGTVFTIEFETKTDDTARVLFDKARVLSFAAQPQNILGSVDGGWYPFEIPTAIPDDFLFTKDLAEGNRNVEVAYLQLVLETENLYDDEITGIFDAQTRVAIQAFQERYAEDVLVEEGTGIVDSLTRSRLNDLLRLKTEGEKPALFDILTKSIAGDRVISRGLGIFVIMLMSATIVLAGGYGIYRKIKKKNVT